MAAASLVLTNADLVQSILDFVPVGTLISANLISKLFWTVSQPRIAKVCRLCSEPFLLKGGILSSKSVVLEELAPEGAHILAESIQEEGVLEHCQTLSANRTEIGDPEVEALSRAVARGALKHLRLLGLYGNGISDEGVIALSSSLGAGALPNLRALLLNSNRVADAGMAALCEAARGGALAQLEKLCLSANIIGDRGAENLASAAKAGAFALVRFLVLERNNIGARGMACLADAISSHNAFPTCTSNMKLPSGKHTSVIPSIHLTGNLAPGLPVSRAIEKRDIITRVMT